MQRNLNRKTRIAVVVPIYNAKKYLKSCIKSVLGQTFKDYSLVLVDDGSKDGRSQVCDKYAAKYNNIYVIHQENKGAVEARKTGILSEQAQNAEYICSLDADDTLDKDALKKLYLAAEMYQADCVCADIRQMWKGIRIPKKYNAKCFDISEPKYYDKKMIMEQLYIGCFGVNNYPVSLCAKIYKTKLITDVINMSPIVKFFGEDLSVTIRMLPETNKLVIIPDTIYNYRIGGGTSRFRAEMLEDFLALYRLKSELINEIKMPQDAEYFINAELLNIIISWLKTCYVAAGYSESQMLQEVESIAALPEVKKAVNDLCNRAKINKLAKNFFENNYKEICDMVIVQSKNENKKQVLKKILYKLG